MLKKLNVALVGLGFGGAFAGIYKEHLSVGELTLFDTNREIAERTAEHIGGAKIADSFEEILADPSSAPSFNGKFHAVYRNLPFSDGSCNGFAAVTVRE
ncbi:MAG: hypothetical protein IJF78_14040 [Clostridia bacterium]|nr:hypothetical protein [Clostridia bacterium]